MSRAAATLVLVIAMVGVAAAEPASTVDAKTPPRLVLVAPPPELESAVRSALAPWKVVIEIEKARAPRDINEATDLADRRHANAVAWLVPGQMVVFERGTADLVRRRVEAGPRDIDEARAAALALTLKTLMRLPPLPPPEEPPPPPPPPVIVAPVIVAPPPPLLWHVGAAAGARVRLNGDLEPRVTLVGERALGAFAVAVDIGVGAGDTIDQKERFGFTGTWRDLFAGVAGLVPIHRGDWRIAPGLGLSAHWTVLDGEVTSKPGMGNNQPAGPRYESEVNVGIDAELGALWTRGHLGAGVRLAASFVPFRDNYKLEKETFYEVSPWEIELGAMVVAAF